jgi:hypothetical protein
MTHRKSKRGVKVASPARKKSRRITMGYVLASNRVMIDRAPVGYLYREKAKLDATDSGWRIFAGDETQEYVDDPRNMVLCNASTLLELAPQLWDLLAEDAPVAFEWDEESDQFRLIDDPTQH